MFITRRPFERSLGSNPLENTVGRPILEFDQKELLCGSIPYDQIGFEISVNWILMCNDIRIFDRRNVVSNQRRKIVAVLKEWQDVT